MQRIFSSVGQGYGPTVASALENYLKQNTSTIKYTHLLKVPAYLDAQCSSLILMPLQRTQEHSQSWSYFVGKSNFNPLNISQTPQARHTLSVDILPTVG